MELDGRDVGQADERCGQRAVVAGAELEEVRAVGHQPADLMEVARGGEPPVDDDQHVLGEALDLLEDVRREEDRAALGGPVPAASP